MPPTVQERFAAGDVVEAHCEHCSAVEQVDLIGLVSFGQGQVPLRQLQVSCRKCGGRVRLIAREPIVDDQQPRGDILQFRLTE